MPFVVLYKSGLLAALLFLQAGGPPGERRSLRYERPVLTAEAGPTCAVLDAEVFTHASGSLKDLRLFSGDRELAYSVAVSETAQVESEPAAVLNLRDVSGGLDFELAMPARAYTQLVFGLEGGNFVAEARVAGSDSPISAGGSPLGTFTLFDFSARGLSRNTMISLAESRFRYLHVRLRGKGFRLRGVEVPPSREGQTLFTTIAETRVLVPRGTETIALLRVPARVPIERVSLTLEPAFAGNFSREIRVTGTALVPGSVAERVTGTILRVRQGSIQMEREAMAASLGANLQSDAEVQVAVENEGKPPLPIASVSLSMRQRTICFDAPGPVVLFYGDPTLASPSYHEPFTGPWKQVSLGPERLNPSFRERIEPQPRFARYRRLLWVGVVVLAALSGTIVVWSGRRRKRMPKDSTG